MITIEDAIKELKDASYREARYGDKDNHHDEVMKRIEAFDMAIQVLDQTRWIPVSEALPARDVNVLAYHRNESFDYQYVSWIDEYSGKWAGFIGNLPDEVLAWMPLPEPYKESEAKK